MLDDLLTFFDMSPFPQAPFKDPLISRWHEDDLSKKLANVMLEPLPARRV